MIKLTDLLNQILSEEKKKADRCLRIARRKYDKSSAYRSGAIVRCRRGEIWKGIKEEVEHYVYRVDSQKIPDFAQNMRTYYHTDDFSTSGQFAKDSEIPKEYTGRITGIFAGTKLFTALYATGNADQTRFVAQYSPGQPTVYFDRQDVPRLKANRSYLTVFDARRFEELPTGEWFSSDPGHPIQQQVISDPFDYITRAGWRIQQVDDLPAMLRKLKAAGVDYGAEGIDEEEYDAESLNEELIREKVKETLRTWFKRKGAPGKTGGWVDCNSPIRKDGKITGYKPCGRQEGEIRSKYPSCRPTPSKCKDPGKGKKWGKTK